MYECWDCGEVYKGSKKGGEIKIYDEEKGKWISKCPNCGSDDFVKANDLDLYDSDSYDSD